MCVEVIKFATRSGKKKKKKSGLSSIFSFSPFHLTEKKGFQNGEATPWKKKKSQIRGMCLGGMPDFHWSWWKQEEKKIPVAGHWDFGVKQIYLTLVV